MRDRIRVNGIKLSHELIHINIFSRPDKRNLNARFLRSMAENRINLPFVSYSAMDRRTQGSFCIAAEDSGRLNQILDLDPGLKETVECLSPVGSVSLFPHKFSLKFLGFLLHVFGEAGLPLYGMAASLSALTATTDFHLLDRAIELIEPHIILPPNHAPFGPQLRIKPI
jgi:hypothetical protein